jgi:hypothetical protein
MTKRLKKPKPRKLKRNPLARELATGKFRPRVVPRPDTYKRRPKHPSPTEEEDQ